jgi:hypothetical protein
VSAKTRTKVFDKFSIRKKADIDARRVYARGAVLLTL